MLARLVTLALTLCLGLLAPPLAAQNGDRVGEVQEENWRLWDVPESPVLTPEDALASFRIAPGFRIELAAAEPLVVDPVAIDFDEHGRLWAVELRAYMPDIDGTGETAPIGRVVVLEDDDGDGRYDRSTPFLEGLVNPRAIAVVRGGVLVGEPPHLWYARDTDGDLRADWRLELTRYGDPNPDHLEHTDNGLHRNLDNWLYDAKSSRRLRLRFDAAGSPHLEEARTAFRGQWGIDHDDRGRLYYNGNSNYLFGDPWPAEYLLRGAAAGRAVGQPPGLGERIVGDESVYGVRVNVGINRGYQPGMLREDGRLARTTSVSGLAVYRGHQFPETFRGDVFVPEPAGNVVAHFRVTDDGVSLRGEQVFHEDPDWGRRAFLASTDERFRPVDCAVGPDGALYVVDLYRGVIQHRQFVTSYLRKQVLERGLAAPVGLGRIWRVVAEERPVDRSSPAALFVDTPARIRTLRHPNGWVRDTAQRLLVEHGDRDGVPLLDRMAREGETPLARVHALWTLEGLGALDARTVVVALGAPEPEVRIAALRVAERLAGTAHAQDALDAIAELPADPDRAVRIQRAFTLGAFAVDRAYEAMVAALVADPADAHLRLAVTSGLAGGAGATLGHIARRDEGELAAVCRELASSALRDDPSTAEPLLALADELLDPHPERALGILDGLYFVLSDRRRKPARLAAPPALLLRAERSEDLNTRLETLLPKLRWPIEGVMPSEDEALLPPLSDEDRARAERGAALFTTCTLCHGPQGEGLRGLGPSLHGSPRVERHADSLVRIILDGLSGPLEIDGVEWNETMPGQRANDAFDDEAIAGLATWLRRQWGHRGEPVTPGTVSEIRSATRDRRLPWTDEELRGMEAP